MASIENQGPQIVAVAMLFLALSWIAVSLRCYVKTFMTKTFGYDDWLSVASLMTFTAYCILVLVGVKYGTGRHLWDLEDENKSIAVKLWWCNELLYTITSALVKASIGIFLARICIKRYLLWTILVVMVAVVVFTTYYLFVLIFQCSPISYFWTEYDKNLDEAGHCVSQTIITGSTYTHGAINVWSDITLCTLPIFLVWNLKMNPRTKISVAVILSLGTLGSIATIIRIPYIWQLTQTGDFLYANKDVAIWSTVEPGIGITAAAMACLRPLFHNFLSSSRLFQSSKRKSVTAWRHISRGRYFRNSKDEEAGVEELALSPGMPSPPPPSLTLTPPPLSLTPSPTLPSFTKGGPPLLPPLQDLVFKIHVMTDT